jgi:uncharacterized membrane protein YeiB
MADFWKRFTENTSSGAILANLNYIILLVLLFVAAVGYGDAWAIRLMNVVAACVGVGLGWVLGIIVSPSDESEQTEFSSYTKAISTLVTGYLAGALKDVKAQTIMDYLREPHIAFRVLMAAACLLATTAVVFINRRAENQGRNRRWYVRFDPASATVPNGTPLGLLAIGPYCSQSDADRQIKELQAKPEYKNVTLTTTTQS